VTRRLPLPHLGNNGHADANGTTPRPAGGSPEPERTALDDAADVRRTAEQAALVNAAGPGMNDAFGRRIEYLRISVTDKCNLRCVYCMPEEGLPWLGRSEILAYEEIGEIVRVMAGMGLRRVRLTGGEPLVRRDLHRLVETLNSIDGITDIALSTNAVLLRDQAEGLRSAGVSRVNVSLDSLRPDRIDAIARRAGSAAAIMDGLAAAEDAGFAPIKVNAVILRGRNDDELEEFARVTLERPWHVRFIEVMPVGENLGISMHEYVPALEMLDRLRRIGDLEPVARHLGSQLARNDARVRQVEQ
jgi:GTP 3',8-cyclase